MTHDGVMPEEEMMLVASGDFQIALSPAEVKALSGRSPFVSNALKKGSGSAVRASSQPLPAV